MQRFVLEPVLFAIFGELLFPQEAVEYYVPHSTIMELYELRDNEQIVTDPSQNERVKENLTQVISFFEQPFVKKKIEKSLRVPWQKSSPILFNENVTFIVVYALDNAEYGEVFDPIETELILTAIKLQLPLITDQLEFQRRIVQHRVPITVLDVADFGFFVEEPELAEESDSMEPGSLADDSFDGYESREPIDLFEAQEGAAPTLTAVEGHGLAQSASRGKPSNPMLPWVFGGFLVILLAGLWAAIF